MFLSQFIEAFRLQLVQKNKKTLKLCLGSTFLWSGFSSGECCQVRRGRAITQACVSVPKVNRCYSCANVDIFVLTQCFIIIWYVLVCLRVSNCHNFRHKVISSLKSLMLEMVHTTILLEDKKIKRANTDTWECTIKTQLKIFKGRRHGALWLWSHYSIRIECSLGPLRSVYLFIYFFNIKWKLRSLWSGNKFWKNKKIIQISLEG